MNRIEACQCDCGLYFERLITHRGWVARKGTMVLVINDVPNPASSLAKFDKHCPGCGVDSVTKVFRIPGEDPRKAMPSTSRNSERYPRYDRGLGMVLTSEGHRRTVCKEKGLIPIEGDWEVPPSIRDQWAASDALVADHESNMKMYNESPDFAEYRKARDTGQLQIALEPNNAATPGVA